MKKYIKENAGNLTIEQESKLLYLDKIRKRKSYKDFSDLYEWLQQPRTPEEIIYKIHKILDNRRAFYSMRNSRCALESIEQIIEENER